MNVKAPRNEHVPKSFYKNEVDRWYAVKKVVLGVFPKSKLYEDWKEKSICYVINPIIKTTYLG